MITPSARTTVMFFLALSGCPDATDDDGDGGAATEGADSGSTSGATTAAGSDSNDATGGGTGGATVDGGSSGSPGGGSSESGGAGSSADTSTSDGSSQDSSSGGTEIECEWQHVLASDRVDAARATAVGASQVVFAGRSGELEGFGGPDRGFLVAYSFDGELQWARQLSILSVSVYSVAIDSQGEIVVAGSTSSPHALWLRKYDADGVELWQREYVLDSGLAHPVDVTIDSDDSIVVAGSVFSGALLGPDLPFGANVANPILMRLDPQGEPTFELQVATAWYEGYRGVTIDTNGELIAVGYTLQGAGFPFGDGIIARYAPDGVLIEQLVFALEPFEEEEIDAIALEPGGDMFIAGSTTSALDGMEPQGGSDAFVARLDSGGALVWGRLFGGPDDDVFETLHLDDSGDLVVGGGMGEDGVLLRYGPDGTELDLRIIGNQVHDAASSPAADLFVAGRRIDPASPDPTFGGIDATVGRVCHDRGAGR